jgi:hypothetical protein
VNIIEQLEEFINSTDGNKWLADDAMEVYVRHGRQRRLTSSITCDTLDIANVTVYLPSNGTFTRFFDNAHRINPWPATFVENVLTDRFANYLVNKLGLSKCERGDYPFSFYKLKTNNK